MIGGCINTWDTLLSMQYLYVLYKETVLKSGIKSLAAALLLLCSLTACKTKKCSFTATS